jgi:hypothetical protein
MRRKAGLFVLVGLLLPLAMAAEASAQGAVLILTPSTATAGQEISVSGTGFTGTGGLVGGVNIRLSTRTSPSLNNSSVTGQGTFGPLPVVLPANIAPGEYLLLGTQTTARGRFVFGSPGRAKLRIVAASSAAGAPGGRTPGDTPPGVIVGTIFALLALTGGTVLCARRLRAHRTQPQLSR